jgi:hypothetical protein
MFGRRPGFACLVRIILEQQVSLAAARTLFRRLDAHVGGISPATIARQGREGLRGLGLTRQKSAYCHGLAERVLDGRLDISLVARSDDSTARAMLLDVPGIGPWTVDIYFLMALRRLAAGRPGARRCDARGARHADVARSSPAAQDCRALGALAFGRGADPLDALPGACRRRLIA